MGGLKVGVAGLLLSLRLRGHGRQEYGPPCSGGAVGGELVSVGGEV